MSNFVTVRCELAVEPTYVCRDGAAMFGTVGLFTKSVHLPMPPFLGLMIDGPEGGPLRVVGVRIREDGTIRVGLALDQYDGLAAAEAAAARFVASGWQPYQPHPHVATAEPCVTSEESPEVR